MHASSFFRNEFKLTSLIFVLCERDVQGLDCDRNFEFWGARKGSVTITAVRRHLKRRKMPFTFEQRMRIFLVPAQFPEAVIPKSTVPKCQFPETYSPELPISRSHIPEAGFPKIHLPEYPVSRMSKFPKPISRIGVFPNVQFSEANPDYQFSRI